jgi:hypothetical protein
MVKYRYTHTVERASPAGPQLRQPCACFLEAQYSFLPMPLQRRSQSIHIRIPRTLAVSSRRRILPPCTRQALLRWSSPVSSRSLLELPLVPPSCSSEVSVASLVWRRSAQTAGSPARMPSCSPLRPPAPLIFSVQPILTSVSAPVHPCSCGAQVGDRYPSDAPVWIPRLDLEHHGRGCLVDRPGPQDWLR